MSTSFRAQRTAGALISAIVASLAIGAAGSVTAQPRDDRRDERRDDRHDDRRDEHRDERHAPAPNRGGPPPRVADERGAGPDHNFRRGGRLSTEYRNRQYVVDDWRGHHLRQPPRGYHWVQTGGDYVLAAIATGVIADILLNQ